MTDILESLEHARAVHQILSTAWWEAYRATKGNLGEYQILLDYNGGR